MNERAYQLGMEDTCFKNATGLDADGHLTCAYDIAIMSRELIKHDIIKKIFDRLDGVAARRKIGACKHK